MSGDPRRRSKMAPWQYAQPEDRDAAKRAADIINLYAFGGDRHVGEWVAIRLLDGGGDGILYPTKEDAIQAQGLPMFFAYYEINTGGITPQDALIYLTYYRNLKSTGRYVPQGMPAWMRWRGGRQIIPNRWKRGDPL